jgi:hypothetical protein
MARSAGPKNTHSRSGKRNQRRWSPEARAAQKRRAEERAEASLLESVPKAAARLGIPPPRAYPYARAHGWPLIETGRGRYAVPKGFVERLLEETVARSLPKNDDAQSHLGELRHRSAR